MDDPDDVDGTGAEVEEEEEEEEDDDDDDVNFGAVIQGRSGSLNL